MHRSSSVSTIRVVGRLLLALGALLLAGTAVTGAPIAAAAAPTFLHAELQVDGNDIVVRGVLYTAATDPLPGRVVTVSGLGTTASAPTGDDGWFTVALPMPANHPAGTISVQVQFGGDQAQSPATTIATTETTAAQPVRLTAQAHQLAAYPGDVILIAGRLLDAAGRPITGASINSSFAGAHTEIYDLTDENGDYSSLAQLPLEATPGTLSLQVVYAGDGARQGGQVSIAIEVLATPTPEPTPSTMASADTPGADQTLQVIVQPTEQTGQPGLSGQKRPTPRQAVPAGAQDSSAFTPGLLLVGSTVALVVLGLALASGTLRHRRQQVALDDRDSFITDASDHEEFGAFGANQAGPRRGFDPDE